MRHGIDKAPKFSCGNHQTISHHKNAASKYCVSMQQRTMLLRNLMCVILNYFQIITIHHHPKSNPIARLLIIHSFWVIILHMLLTFRFFPETLFSSFRINKYKKFYKTFILLICYPVCPQYSKNRTVLLSRAPYCQKINGFIENFIQGLNSVLNISKLTPS